MSDTLEDRIRRTLRPYLEGPKCYDDGYWDPVPDDFPSTNGPQDYVPYHRNTVPDVPNVVPSPKGPLPAPKWSTPVIQFPFPGMVLDTSTNTIRWAGAGDHLRSLPVAEWGIDQRLLTAFSYTEEFLLPDVYEQLAQLFSTRNLPYFSGALALWAGSHFFGVGEVFDVAMITAAVIGGGIQAAWVAQDLWDYIEIASKATSAEDLRRAAKHLSRVITVVGVDVILGIFLKAGAKTKTGRRVLNRVAAVERRIEQAGLSFRRRLKTGPYGFKRMLEDIRVPFQFDDLNFSFHADDLPWSMRYSPRNLPVPIVPPTKVTSPNAMRKASRTSGMHVQAVMQAQAVAHMNNVRIVFRPAKLARKSRLKGLKPKEEWMKMKTLEADDALIGGPSHNPSRPNRVGFFEPTEPPANLQQSDPAKYKRLQERYEMRKREYARYKGVVDAAKEAKVIRVENGLIVDVDTGKQFAGDYDPYGIFYTDGRIVPPTDPTYWKVMDQLGNPNLPIKAQHGPNIDDWPTTPDEAVIRSGIIRSHVTEPLVEFYSDGSVWRTWVDPTDWTGGVL